MRARWMAVMLALVLLGLAVGAAGQEKDKKKEKEREAQLRTVRGAVVDKEENPVPAGVVYLKNLKTQSVKTYIADDAGQYRFSGLDPNVDYEIHAEHEDLTSSKRTISSLDSRKEIVIHLKVSKRKGDK